MRRPGCFPGWGIELLALASRLFLHHFFFTICPFGTAGYVKRLVYHRTRYFIVVWNYQTMGRE